MEEGETRALPELAPAVGVNFAVDPEEQFATRAAWLSFVASLTQAQIGRKLGINRTRVNRLLAQARGQGLVQINITGRLASCVELEEKLKQIPCVVIASGGRTKAQGLRGVLNGGMCDVIITDGQTARSILAMEET